MMTLPSGGSAGIAGVSPASCERAGRPRSRGAPARTGFTLVELLVATGIFVLGFSVCLGLFLAGMRHRSAAEDHLRLGFAASSLIEELAIGPMANGAAPSSYVSTTGSFQKVSNQHANVWYRIEKCQNAIITSTTASDPGGKDDPKADALLTTLLVVSFATPSTTSLTFEDINRRLRVITPPPTTLTPPDQAKVADYLLSRQLALRMETIILRRAP